MSGQTVIIMCMGSEIPTNTYVMRATTKPDLLIKHECVLFNSIIKSVRFNLSEIKVEM